MATVQSKPAMAASAPDDMNKIYADIYGKNPPEVELLERRLSDLERGIGRLPEDRKSSVLKAMMHHPILFVSSAHSVLFMREEEFDAADGALRMARYWEQRERYFGERAFTTDVFQKPTRLDYLRFYQRSLSLAEDPDADDTMREIAKEYVKNVKVSKIRAMDRAIEEAPVHEKTAFLDAQRKSPDLAASDEHKLLFLQAEEFVEEKAAQRMIKYWQMKYEVFGPDIAVRKITLDDLSGYEKELSSGVMRLMPSKDQSGRSVVVCTMSQLKDDDLKPEGLAAAVWYVWNAALESTSCQENGVVFLASYVDMCPEAWERASSIRKSARKIVTESLPVKIKALHLCVDSNCSWWKRILLVLARLIKMRTMVYFEVGEEFAEQLQQCGVLAECIPVELGGDVSLESWKEWLNERKKAGF